jgi:hypothetical protein
MIEEKSMDKQRFHFILIQENKIAAFIQQGNSDDHVIAEIIRKEALDSILTEINATVLSDPWSAAIADIGNWNYMQQYCFTSANQHGKFLWACFDPECREYQCGFEIAIKDDNNREIMLIGGHKSNGF